jgi:hypothetical protein
MDTRLHDFSQVQADGQANPAGDCAFDEESLVLSSDNPGKVRVLL